MAKKKTKAVDGIRDKRKSKKKVDGSPLSAAKIAEIERRYQVVCLRRDGYTLDQIAGVLNTTVVTVRQDIIKALKYTIEETAETVEENRQLAVSRLDQLLRVYTPLATEVQSQKVHDKATGTDVVIKVPPNPLYAQLVLSIEARRAKLLALDVPEVKKIEQTGIREYRGVDVDRV